MTGEDATLTLIDALDTQGVPYMVVGSFSTNHYGIPRSTKDADFVVDSESLSIGRLARDLGPGFDIDRQLSFETVTGTTRHEIKVAAASFKIELFQLSRDPHDRERFRRRIKASMLGRSVWLPTPEDVIITKLRWSLLAGRSKDRDDARDVIAVQGDRIDWDYVYPWCDRHGTRDLLDEVRRSIPPL
jgi:hypothetical protein